MSRTVPTSGTDRQRIATAAAGLFLPNEIHTTSDERRAFMGGTYLLSGGVWQGIVATQTAMLGINSSSARGCFPMDVCYRSDLDQVMLCTANRGTSVGDWQSLGKVTPAAVPTAETVATVQTITGFNGDTVQAALDFLFKLVYSRSLGEANTVTMIGSTGVDIYKDKVGVSFELRKLKAGSNITLTVTGSDEIQIDSTGGGGSDGSLYLFNNYH